MKTIIHASFTVYRNGDPNDVIAKGDEIYEFIGELKTFKDFSNARTSIITNMTKTSPILKNHRIRFDSITRLN